MNIKSEKVKVNFIRIVKFLICLLITGVVAETFISEGLDPYYKYKDYKYQDELTDTQTEIDKTISQEFVAKGNILDSISLYIKSCSADKITLGIYDKNNKCFAEKTTDTLGYTENSWNNIGIYTDKLTVNETYILKIASEDSLNDICVVNGQKSEIFKDCAVDDQKLENVSLAVGMQFTHKYLTSGMFFSMLIKILISLILICVIWWTVYHIEVLYQCYLKQGKLRGVLGAFYFSTSFILLYNPLAKIRNEVTDFKRVIGNGILANVDVAKRINNFTQWFIFYILVFMLFALTSNYLFSRQKSEEQKKIEHFLQHYMILANCCLLFKVLTFFSDAQNSKDQYSFSSYIIMLIALIATSYIVCKLDRYISVEEFVKGHLILVSISIPIAINLTKEWDEGRILLGIIFILTVLYTIVCRWLGNIGNRRNSNIFSTGVVMGMAGLPLLTSVFIELIPVLNQHRIFVGHPLKYYNIAIFLSCVLILGFSLIIVKKHRQISNWRSWSFPCYILGISCLSVQFPISATYNLNIYEGANYGVLISDFLNYGKIPLVEHYGGHMMTSVWEGILYGIINNDYKGAYVAPYAALLTPVLAVLFFYLVKSVWNEEMAFLTVLVFPFYKYWSIFGLGMLICITVAWFVRKNTYTRAAFIWAAVIWCVIYRMDLGVAYGVATVIALIIYVIVIKKWDAAKKLIITLAAWGVSGLSIWTVICIIKDINPIKRLIEFVMISLSNQNWGYSQIGNIEYLVYGWSYILIPFLCAVCLCFTIFSKKMRDCAGMELWMSMLIFGWAVFQNFSRGLVRHSLVENRTTYIVGTAYIFLALFLCVKLKNPKLFLPFFLLLMLVDTALIQQDNYTGVAIVDNAATQSGNNIESWVEKENEETYWEQVKNSQQIIQRVSLDDGLNDYVQKYSKVLDTLLDGDETFVDFINKTSLYPLLGRENPLYISQSPMQMSGEYTQKEFVEQMKSSPIILMPANAGDYYESTKLDDIANAYRYYMVSEYIYQNYEPLCQAGNDYAIWCRKDKYADYKAKLGELGSAKECKEQLKEETVVEDRVNVIENADGDIELQSTGEDPKLLELQNLLDASLTTAQNIEISVSYETDTPGLMEVYYTLEPNEGYSADRVQSVEISGTGEAVFNIPVSKDLKIRFDIPDNSTVKIKSFIVKPYLEYVTYGYDGPQEGNYTGVLHNYALEELPRIWAENDEKDAANNEVLSELSLNDTIYQMDSIDDKDKEDGNYLKITAEYDGTNTNGYYKEDDEEIREIILLGKYENGEFVEKCKYTLTLKEGTHEYLIRCSSDYYWYTGDINAVKVQGDEAVRNIKIDNMQILKGD